MTRPRGWIGLDYGESTVTPHLLAEAGLDYVADWGNDDQVYFLATNPPLLSIPNQAEWDDVQLIWQTAALDGGAQHLLASASVLVHHPASMDQHSTEVVHEQEQVGALAARHAWERHERTHEHVAHLE